MSMALGYCTAISICMEKLNCSDALQALRFSAIIKKTTEIQTKSCGLDFGQKEADSRRGCSQSEGLRSGESSPKINIKKCGVRKNNVHDAL